MKIRVFTLWRLFVSKELYTTLCDEGDDEDDEGNDEGGESDDEDDEGGFI